MSALPNEHPALMRDYAARVRRGFCLFCASPAPHAATCGGYLCLQHWRRLNPDDRHYLIWLRYEVRPARTARRRWPENLAPAAAAAVTLAAFGVLAWPLLRLLIAGK